jgi:peptide/nickel transport system substrate-binding protein
MRRALGLGRAGGHDVRARCTSGRGASRKRAAVAAVAGAGLAVVLAACGASTRPTTVGTTPVSGGTATYAIQPASNVNYIFPFMGGSAGLHFTAYNVNDFQYLMYRPLYWFGQGAKPYLNESLSLAYLPRYHGQQVSITLKPTYKWSNGEPVGAQDVVFWMNMMKASQNLSQGYWRWVATTPGGLPGDVTNVHATGKYTVSMTIKGPYSESWFTNNELSQITPMPMYWDRTSATQVSHCATVISDCFAVYSYLAAQANNPQNYARSPIWSVVDGPWKLQSYTSQGTLTLVINSHYGGDLPPHHITKFVEVPFTSGQAEYNVLQNPTGSQAIDVGYLPTVDAPVLPGNASVGPNPSTLPNYKLAAVYPWGLSFFSYNFNNNTGQGVIFKQLYFRQALQSLVDQQGVIEGPLHGYGKATIGPVGDYPQTRYLSTALKQKGDQWPLNPTLAKSLLKSHGWSVRPGGPDICQHAGRGNGKCGPGVPAGAQLDFKIIYASGLDWMESQIKELASNASEVGIRLTVTAEPFDAVVGTGFSPCTPGKPCTWQLADWGGWIYQSDLLPTGETLFASGAIDNAGRYSEPHNDHLIQATLRAKTPAALNQAMYAWENYLAAQLPVVYQPLAPYLVETINNLHTGPQNSTLTINPENWYFLK